MVQVVDKPYVRTENIFPDHDAAWNEAKEFTESIAEKKTILAPFEFAQFFPEILPVQFSYFEELNDLDVVILNKAQIDRYSDKFVAELVDRFHYAFGNAVFNIFTKKPSQKSGEIKHRYDCSSFKDRLKSSVRERRRSSTFLSLPRLKKPVVLIVSASKFGNAGDDAITEAACSIIKRAIKGAQIILARPPFSRLDVDKADIVVLGGGGVLYDSCFNNAMNYCDYILYADSKGKETLGIGLGTQGIKSLRGQELYQKTLSKCKVLVVRNEKDQEVLKEHCKVTAPVFTTNDIVFYFGRKLKCKKYKSESNGGRLNVAISLLDSKNLLAAKAMRDYREACEDSIDFLCRNHNVFFVAQSKDDLQLYEKYINRYGAKLVSFDYGHTLDYIKFYQTVDLTITSRFHGYIFSLLAQAPVISVGSNAGKIDRLIRSEIRSGRYGHIPLKDFSFDQFMKKYEEFQCERQLYIADRSETARSIESAESTVDIVRKSLS